MQQQLKHIKEKLQQLIKQHQQLQNKNVQLQKNSDKKDAIIAQQQQQLNDLQKQNDVTSISSKILSKQEKKMLEKRIETYIKEIDDCINELNKH